MNQTIFASTFATNVTWHRSRTYSITQCIHIHHLQQKCPQKSLLPPFLDRGVAFSILIISREIDPKKSICFASLIWEACDWHVGCYSNFSVGILDFSILPIPLCTAGCLTKLTMIESLNDWKPPRDLEINKMYTHSHAKTKWKYYVQYVTDLLLQQQLRVVYSGCFLPHEMTHEIWSSQEME